MKCERIATGADPLEHSSVDFPLALRKRLDALH